MDEFLAKKISALQGNQTLIDHRTLENSKNGVFSSPEQ
jgi:hypothetical protein